MNEKLKLLPVDADIGLDLIIKLCENRIFMQISRYVSDYDLAKDVYQNTLITIWKGYYKIFEAKDPYFWIMAIAKNQSLKAIRDERIGFKDSIEVLSNMCGCESADQKLTYDEIVELLKGTNVLNVREKNIVIAVDVEGISLVEISELYDLKPQTVKNVLHIARGKVRKLIGKRE